MTITVHTLHDRTLVLEYAPPTDDCDSGAVISVGGRDIRVGWRKFRVDPDGYVRVWDRVAENYSVHGEVTDSERTLIAVALGGAAVAPVGWRVRVTEIDEVGVIVDRSRTSDGAAYLSVRLLGGHGGTERCVRPDECVALLVAP